MYGSNANAEDWQISPAISAVYSYIDNVDLSANQKNGDAIISIIPEITAAKKSTRMDFAANYAVQVVRYRDNDQADNEYQSGGLLANFKFVPEKFQLETNAVYGQQPIAVATAPVPPNVGFISTNRTNVLTYYVKPILTLDHGKYVAFYADYTYEGFKADEVAAGNDHVKNTKEHVALENPKSSQRLAWSFDYQRNRFDITGADNQYTDTKLSLAYRVTPWFSLIASGGKEENEVTNSLLGSGDTYWKAGFSWQPSTRTAVTITHGKRFFGDSTYASISHKRHRTEFSLSYDETLTSTASIQISNAGTPTTPLLPVVNDFVLQKAFYLKFSGKSSKTEYGINLASQKLTYQTSLAREDYNTGNIFFEWRTSPRNSIRLGAGRQEITLHDTNAKYYFDSREFKYSRNFSRRFSTTLTLANYENKSNTGLNEYTANYYGFTLTWRGR
jgi:hypothetical protein